jgi:hypothetical protein
MSSAGFGTKNGCAGKGQRQFPWKKHIASSLLTPSLHGRLRTSAPLLKMPILFYYSPLLPPLRFHLPWIILCILQPSKSKPSNFSSPFWVPVKNFLCRLCLIQSEIACPGDSNLSLITATRSGGLYKLNPLRNEFLLNNIYKFSPYLTGNTLRLRYRDQSVNAVRGNSRCLLWEPCGTHKCRDIEVSATYATLNWLQISVKFFPEWLLDNRLGRDVPFPLCPRASEPIRSLRWFP